eukprot:1044812-Prymnesium_polylepis.1
MSYGGAGSEGGGFPSAAAAAAAATVAAAAAAAASLRVLGAPARPAPETAIRRRGGAAPAEMRPEGRRREGGRLLDDCLMIA